MGDDQDRTLRGRAEERPQSTPVKILERREDPAAQEDRSLLDVQRPKGTAKMRSTSIHDYYCVKDLEGRADPP